MSNTSNDKNEIKQWLNSKRQRHRIGGPAVIFPDGSKKWYFNGKLHRIGGPAIECSYGDKRWYVNGQRHRTDGPAVIWADGHKEWWINGKQLTYEEFRKQYLIKKLTSYE